MMGSGERRTTGSKCQERCLPHVHAESCTTTITPHLAHQLRAHPCTPVIHIHTLHTHPPYTYSTPHTTHTPHFTSPEPLTAVTWDGELAGEVIIRGPNTVSSCFRLANWRCVAITRRPENRASHF
jgi:hypothetical protein